MIKQNRNVLSYFWKISVSASEITPIEFLRWCIVELWASHMTLVIKNTPAGDTRGVGSILGSGRSSEKEIATHSSILAWRIPWTEEPGGLQSTGSQRVRQDWSDLTWHDRVELWCLSRDKYLWLSSYG